MLRLESLEPRLALAGNISGTVFNDLNSNGLFEPVAGELGAPNQTVYLDTNLNAALDVGEVSVLTSGTGTYTFAGVADGTSSVRLLLDAVTSQTFPTTNGSSSLFASLLNAVDHVYDVTTAIDYISTSAGNIERFDARTGKFLAPFKVGVSLGGLDITPDGRYLYVAEQQPGTTQSFVRKVDTQSGVVTDLGFNRIGAESGSYDVAILNNGKAFFTTQQAGGVRGPLREINLTTDAITIRSGLVGASDIAPFTRLNRNSERSAVVFTEPVATLSTAFFYKTATDAFSDRVALNSGVFFSPAAISRDGSLAAIATSAGVRIINTTTTSPTIIRTLPGAQLGGLVFDPYRNVLYVGNDITDQIVPYENVGSSTFTQLAAIDIGENIAGAGRYFQLQVAPDGKRLLLVTSLGVRSYPLYAQTSRLATVSGSDVTGIDFGVHIFPNIRATGQADYYVMTRTQRTLTVNAANGVLPNDRDPDLTQSLTARLVRQATRGFVALNPDGSFVYTANATLDIKDTFEYVIHDGWEDSAPISGIITRGPNKGSSISGREFLDLNQNGVYEPANGETPIPGVRVFLDLNNNGYWDEPTDPFLFTSADGSYNFTEIAAGTYQVRSEVPAGSRPTGPVAPVNFGTLLPLANIRDFLYDSGLQILYIATAGGSVLRYSTLANAYLAPINVGGSPSALETFGPYLFVGDSQETGNQSFVHRVNIFDGTVTTIPLDTSGTDTGVVDLAYAGDKLFITVGSSVNGTVLLRQIDSAANPDVVTTRAISIGSGIGGTIAASTRMTRNEDHSQVYFQERSATGHIFFYRAATDEFVNGPLTQTSPAGSHTSFTARQGGLVASNQFGPSIFDSSYRAQEIFSNTFNAGLAFNGVRDLLYAVDGIPDVVIGYDSRTHAELFRVTVGEDVASAPLKAATVSPDGQLLFVSTPSGIRIFNIGLPGKNEVVLREDSSVTGINFGQEPIPQKIYVDVPGGIMSEAQGVGALSGIVTRTGPDLSQDLFVNLTSSNTGRASVPVAVLIPAGQPSVTFSIDAVDNNLLDTNLSVVITASAAGYSPNTDFIIVTDHETLSIALASHSIPEVGGTTTATVTRSSTDLSSSLVVALSSSDTSEATVPATVTIPVNEASVTFTVNAVDDLIFDGTRSAVISATAAGYLSINDSVNVVSDLDSYRNILVTTVPTLNNPRLHEYSPAGVKVSDIPVPFGPGSDQPVRDLVVDGGANVQMFNGTAEPSLSTFDPRRNSFSHHTTPGWSTANVPAQGGIAVFNKYIFVTDISTGTGDDLLRGLIRFDTTDYSSVRFATTTDFTDVAMGQDGLLYGLDHTPVVPPNVPVPPYKLQVYNPNTLNFVRTITLASPQLPLAISVNAQGQIFAVLGDNLIYEFAPNGSFARTLVTGGTKLNELDISPEGQLIAAGATGDIVVMNDPGHDLPTSFKVGATQAFVAFGNLNRADGLTLSISPTTFVESAGPAASAGTVTRPSLADLSVSLTVTLATNDTSEADVQQVLTIAAGRATASFNIQAIDDSTGDGPQTVTFTALAPGQIGASATLTVQDDEINYFTVSFSPTSMSESGGSLTGTVTRFVADNSLPQIVDLSSNDTTEATVPLSVTILANQNSATFTVTAVDDAVRDGTQKPLITASATGMGPASGTVAVTDDEIDSISLSISPGVISENGGAATGTVMRAVGNNSSPFVVSLSSSDTTEASVPTTVTIPANQNSVTFTVSGVDDTIRDNTQGVVITASAAGMASTTANVSVTDDELDSLTMNLLDNFMFENGGSINASVTRAAADNSQPLVVTLSSSDETEATVPSTVVILANENVATFTISGVDDTVSDGPQAVTITGAASGHTTASGEVRVGDDERPYQNQRHPLDVDDNGGIFALDALKIINIVNEIGSGDAATIMAQYTGPQIYPDTNGDSFISANDVLLVINHLNTSPPPVGGEGEADGGMLFSPAAIVAPSAARSPAQVRRTANSQNQSQPSAAAVLAIVDDMQRRTSAGDVPRGKRLSTEWDDLISDLAKDLLSRRLD